MKRVYLDWGVVSNLKKPELVEVREFLLAHKGELFFVYSPAHFEDAMRSGGDNRLLQDIRMLESLVDNHLLAYDNKTVRPYLATPTEYYKDKKGQNLDAVPDFQCLLSSIDRDFPIIGGMLKSVLDLPFPVPEEARSQQLFDKMFHDLPDTPSLNDVINSGLTFVNNMLGDKSFYKSFRQTVQQSGLKLSSNAGNWKAEEVIPNISSRMRELGLNMTFEEFVLAGFGNRDKVDDFQFFIAAYSMLDFIGYKSDKLPKPTNAMNSVSTDAQHAFYAAFCDYLITQDTHLKCKAMALYNELKIPTKIIGPSEIVTELDDSSERDPGVFFHDQFNSDHIERCEDGAIVYKFDRRFWGIFTHCVVYKLDDATLFEFKLAFDNYSRFIFYDEARILIDTVLTYLGRPLENDYEIAKEQIVYGDTEVSINWHMDNMHISLKADAERHRPELFIRFAA